MFKFPATLDILTIYTSWFFSSCFYFNYYMFSCLVLSCSNASSCVFNIYFLSWICLLYHAWYSVLFILTNRVTISRLLKNWARAAWKTSWSTGLNSLPLNYVWFLMYDSIVKYSFFLIHFSMIDHSFFLSLTV